MSMAEPGGNIPDIEAFGYSVTSTGNFMDAEPTEMVVQYIGNKNSQVFHVPTCDSVRDMKDKNKVHFYTCEEALELNYKPCQRCNP